MRITFISDIHGDPIWKEVVKKNSDMFVFLGDYFDSFTISKEDQVENFKELIYFGENNREKSTFLLGNHDIHYLLWHTEFFNSMRGSGFNESIIHEVNNLYREHSSLFKIAYQKGKILATHAGLRQDYYDNELKVIHKRYKEYNYADFLNMLWILKSGKLMRIGMMRGGMDRWGGVFWCDKNELLQSPLKGMTQVVGHSPIMEIEDIKVDEDTRLVFTDCMIYNKEKLNIFEIEVE